MDADNGEGIGDKTKQLMEQTEGYHLDFSQELPELDGAVILVSSDRLRFKVNANALRSASEVFRTTLSLPQAGEPSPEAVMENLGEEGSTIAGILSIITSQELPSLKTIDEIEPLLWAADKWDMPGPLSLFRLLLIRDPSFTREYPIRLYKIGAQMDWKDLVSLAVRRSSYDDIFNKPDLIPIFHEMGTHRLLPLVKLHNDRHRQFQTILDDTFIPGTTISSEDLAVLTKVKRVVMETAEMTPIGTVLKNVAIEKEITTLVTVHVRNTNKRFNAHSAFDNSFSFSTMISAVSGKWSSLPQALPSSS